MAPDASLFSSGEEPNQQHVHVSDRPEGLQVWKHSRSCCPCNITSELEPSNKTSWREGPTGVCKFQEKQANDLSLVNELIVYCNNGICIQSTMSEFHWFCVRDLHFILPLSTFLPDCDKVGTSPWCKVKTQLAQICRLVILIINGLDFIGLKTNQSRRWLSSTEIKQTGLMSGFILAHV